MADERTPEPGYPRWRYHATNPAVLVNSSAEEKELGDGWVDTPAKFAGDQAAAPDAPPPPQPPAPPAPPEVPPAGTGKSRTKKGAGAQ